MTEPYIYKIVTPQTKVGDEVDGNDWNRAINWIFQHNDVVFADSPYTASAEEYFLEVDTTDGDITINLPSAVTYPGKRYFIKKIVAANTVTVDPNGGQTIDGSATVALTDRWSSLNVQSNGANWFKVDVPGATGTITGAANVGTGDGQVFRDESAGDLNLRTIKAGSNITVTNNADDITIAASSLSAAIDDLSDVTITAAASGDFLRHSGAAWVDSTIQVTDIPAHASTHTTGGSDAIGTDFITGRTEDTSPSAANDLVLTYDASATAFKKVKLTNLPGGSGSGISTTGLYNVDEVGGAAGDGSTDDTSDIQDTIDAAGAYGQTTLSSNSQYRIEDHLTLDNDGAWFNGQQGRLILTTSMTADGLISVGAPGAGADTYIEQRVTNLGIDFNSQTHGHGITNYDATGGASPVDAVFKGLIIEKIFFTGHTTAGKSCIYLRNLENGCVIRDIRAESVTGSAGTPTSIIKIENAGSGANHGNFVLDGGNHLSSSSSSTRFIEVTGNANFQNRVSIKGQWHCFYAASTAANLQRAVYFHTTSGNDLNNRGWELTGLHQEDTQYGVYVETDSGTGLGALNIHDNDFENKDPAGASVADASKGITFEGTGEVWGEIHSNSFLWGKSGSTGFYVGIDLTNLVVDSAHKMHIHNNFFYARAGSTTATAIRGVAGQSRVLIYDNEGYNPVGTISSPWKSTGLYNEISGGSSLPTTATTYTCYNTKKRITATGGTTSQIQINGVNTNMTSGSFILEPGDTIRFTGVPASATVYCY